jgi:hypothetical protein
MVRNAKYLLTRWSLARQEGRNVKRIKAVRAREGKQGIGDETRAKKNILFAPSGIRTHAELPPLELESNALDQLGHRCLIIVGFKKRLHEGLSQIGIASEQNDYRGARTTFLRINAGPDAP